MADSQLKKNLAARSGGKNYPVLSIARKQPELAAIASKLIPSRIQPLYDRKGNQDISQPNTNQFRELANNKTQDIIDSRLTQQMLPDLEVASQILISSIISPKDLTTTEINYNTVEDLLPPNVNSAMITEIRKCFEQIYKIKDQLPVMLKDILFDTGSYAVAILPENAIDEVINGSRVVSAESMGSLMNSQGIVPMHILGPVINDKPKEVKRFGYTLEEFQTSAKVVATDPAMRLQLDFKEKDPSTCVSVTDNMHVLKMPLIKSRMRSTQIHHQVHGFGMESYSVMNPTNGANHEGLGIISNKMTDRELRASLFKGRNIGYTPIVSLKTQNQLNRYTVGEPLVMHLPSESVIPVHVPGRPEEKIGIFVLLDQDGYPISQANTPDEFRKMQSRLNSTATFASSMLSKVKTQMEGFDWTNPGAYDYSAQVYGDFIERDLMARLRNGRYDNGVALASNPDVYRIMLARSLQEQNTQLLFIPIEFVTYMAFDYDKNGLGRSLLDNNRILNTMRVMTMFADTMAGIRNSIGRTNVNVKLDPDDPDPTKTRESIIHEIARSRVSSFPLGANTIADMVDGIMQAGIEIHVSGHEGLPDMDVQFDEKASNFAKPDQDLRDNLRKLSIMGTYVTPEMVDSSFQPEFATIFSENNVMMAKRAASIQDKLLPQLSDIAKKYIVSSGNLYQKLISVLHANFDELKKFLKNRDDLFIRGYIKTAGLDITAINKTLAEGKKPEITDEMLDESKTLIIERLMSEFVDGLHLTLPRPSSMSLEKQMEAYTKYKEALKEAIDTYMDGTALTDQFIGEGNAQLDSIKANILNYFLREYLAENGMFPELAKLTNLNTDGKLVSNVVDLNSRHIEAMLDLVTDSLKAGHKLKEKANKQLEKIGVENPTSTGGSDWSSSSSTTDDTGSGGDNLGGLNDLGGGLGDLDDLGDGTPEDNPEGVETPPIDTDQPAGDQNLDLPEDKIPQTGTPPKDE